MKHLMKLNFKKLSWSKEGSSKKSQKNPGHKVKYMYKLNFFLKKKQ